LATRKQKMKVGAFLIICIGIMVVGVTVIAGLYDDVGQEYWMEFEDSILGLPDGGLVEFLGVPVGRVRNIYIAENGRAHVTVTIDPTRVTLHEGVEAQLVLYSFAAGTMAIALKGGEPTAPELAPGSEIPARSTPFATISGQIEELMEQLSVIFDQVSLAMDGMEEGGLANIVTNVNRLLEDGQEFMARSSDLIGEAAGTIGGLRETADTAIAEFEGLTRDIRGIVGDVQSLVNTTDSKLTELDMQQMQTQLTRVLQNVADLTESLVETVAKVDEISGSTLHEVSNIEYSLRRSLEDITRAFDSVRSLVDDMQQDPAAILRGRAPVRD